MKALIILLVLSILANVFGVLVLYKYFQKDKTLRATVSELRAKDETLAQVNRQLDNRLVFVHHSVGRNWLSQGGLRDSLMARGIAVRSISRGTTLGEETDMCHWVPKFQSEIDRIIKFDHAPNIPFSGPEENDIIMFKSCYPNSNVMAGNEGEGSATDSTATLANYRAVMAELEPVLAAHPGKKFVYVTSPPLIPERTTSENAARARQFNEWVKSEFLTLYNEHTGQTNLLVFDLFDVLSDDANVLKEEYRRGDNDAHPNRKANREATKRFLAFLDQHRIGWEEQE